jgi:hypothetical protein
LRHKKYISSKNTKKSYIKLIFGKLICIFAVIFIFSGSMHNSASFRLFVLVIVASVAFSCRSTRDTAVQNADFQTFAADLKFTWRPSDNAKSTTVDGRMSFRRNQLINISLRAPIINTEVARISIMPDRFVMLDRFNKTFIDEPPENLRFLLHKEYTFNELQALFTSPVQGDATPDSRTVSIEDEGFRAMFDLSKIAYGSEINADIAIPDKYKRIDIEKLIKSQFSTE